jgi:hypothetical protein
LTGCRTVVQVFRTCVLLFSFLKARWSILTCLRVFVFEFLNIHFDAHAFLLVGNVFEGSNVVSGALLQPFVVGNHDSSGQEITLQSNRVLVVFPLRESRLVHAKQPGKLLLAQIDMLSQKTQLFTAKPVRFLKNGNSPEVTFLLQNIYFPLQLEAAEPHLYEQHKRENAGRCLPA